MAMQIIVENATIKVHSGPAGSGVKSLLIIDPVSRISVFVPMNAEAAKAIGQALSHPGIAVADWPLADPKKNGN